MVVEYLVTKQAACSTGRYNSLLGDQVFYLPVEQAACLARGIVPARRAGSLLGEEVLWYLPVKKVAHSTYPSSRQPAWRGGTNSTASLPGQHWTCPSSRQPAQRAGIVTARQAGIVPARRAGSLLGGQVVLYLPVEQAAFSAGR
ncbi:hypothetical protein PCASD_15881 [Puccinia coronata f. sp. avenae]|uniref:Uncharacterized protein n=1 Tax=Puccinia coronata f. sp. avenae TaxID=200324 RepID=A0A2N5U7X9_9BASI|nr:hypothetical protein PCASD_15881 [Puccinia coronata f. sp. avenae]